MGLISTWIWFWFSLLLNLSSVKGDPLACASCTNDQCKEGPFNTIKCTDDPNAACLTLYHRKYLSLGIELVPMIRSCAHAVFVGKLGGAIGHCTQKVNGGEVNAAMNWLSTAPDDQKLGGEEKITIDTGYDYIVCACAGDPKYFDKCNEKEGREGSEYTVEKKEGNGGATLRPLGGMIILSVWRAVHNHIHMNGF